MPIFEYVCCDCEHQFEKLILSSKDPKPDCPECKSKEVSKLMSAGCIRAHGIAKGAGGFKAPKCAPAAGG